MGPLQRETRTPTLGAAQALMPGWAQQAKCTSRKERHTGQTSRRALLALGEASKLGGRLAGTASMQARMHAQLFFTA